MSDQEKRLDDKVLEQISGGGGGSGLEQVSGGGILEIMGYHEDPPKDDPWTQN